MRSVSLKSLLLVSMVQLYRGLVMLFADFLQYFNASLEKNLRNPIVISEQAVNSSRAVHP